MNIATGVVLVTADTSGILVQQHTGNNNFFNRSWQEFKVGFGNASDDYWIGNERLHQLTKDGKYKLRFDLLAKFNARWYWAEYERFSISSEIGGYALIIDGYSGNAGDAMTGDGIAGLNLNGVKFTTFDRDNDHSAAINCALNSAFIGGFWYTSCGSAHVNQNAYFQWMSLPIGNLVRTGSHVALQICRMTLLPK